MEASGANRSIESVFCCSLPTNCLVCALCGLMPFTAFDWCRCSSTIQTVSLDVNWQLEHSSTIEFSAERTKRCEHRANTAPTTMRPCSYCRSWCVCHVCILCSSLLVKCFLICLLALCVCFVSASSQPLYIHRLTSGYCWFAHSSS